MSTATVQRFCTAIEDQLGLNYSDKLDFLAGVLASRVQETKTTAESYLTALETLRSPLEWRALGERLTISETYFFRHSDQFSAFVEIALPQCLRQRNGAGISILSAGSASGEEAFSLAIMVLEQNLIASVSITGIDLSPIVINKALRGRYTAWSLRDMPEATREKYFSPVGCDFQLDESIRTRVAFEQRNLADDDPEFWRPGRFDIVFCRNVMMYFSPQSTKTLIKRIHRALHPGGFLFVGHAEALRGLSDDFDLCHTHNTFYYQRRSQSKPLSATQSFPTFPVPATPPAIFSAQNSAWMDAIRLSSERIQALSQPALQSIALMPEKKPCWNLHAAHGLLRDERFAEALNALAELPAEAADDADALLLKAVLYVHMAQPEDAERICLHLLANHPRDAGAQYVLALCREAAGADAEAVSHFQAAAYLSPEFAMAHLHLGLHARRRGAFDLARGELNQALTLLQHEEVSRLLLFGGGFGRDGLLMLCRAELDACGARHEPV